MDDEKIKDKQKRVKAKLKKLNNIFKELPDDRKTAVKDLIQNCAFIVVELEDLQVMIQQYGAVEKYQNGQNQWGMKPSSAVQVYNNLLKSYNTSIKLLLGELPETEKKESKNELADFLMGANSK